MKYKGMKWIAVMSVCAFMACTALAQTQEEKIAAMKEKLDTMLSGKGDGGKFMGSNACKTCHMMPKLGAQFKKWADTKHAKAYESLLSEEGKKRAAAKNIAKPEEDPNCLKCHAPSAALAADLRDEKCDPTKEGVGCESCHGPGGKHIPAAKPFLAKPDQLPDEARMMKIDDPELRSVLCARCHHEHEWHDMADADFEKNWEKISHKKAQ